MTTTATAWVLVSPDGRPHWHAISLSRTVFEVLGGHVDAGWLILSDYDVAPLGWTDDAIWRRARRLGWRIKKVRMEVVDG